MEEMLPKKLSELVPLEDRKYILQDRDNDYVLDVKPTGLDTVKLHFTWTKDRDKARLFSYEDLWWKLATTCIGVHFSAGFAGGKAVRVK